MKKTNRRPGKKQLKKQSRAQGDQPKSKSRKLLCAIVILGVITVGFISWLVLAKIGEARLESIHRKAIAIGLFNAPSEIEERHVWITGHPKVAGRYGDVPVHILFRPNQDAAWRLCGTGTKLGKRPNYLLTAHHVFAGQSGQYGARQIGPNEFTGAEKVVPIVSCDCSGNADDAVLCSIDENRADFPALTVLESTNMFHGWQDKSFRVKMWPLKIRLTTYPEKEIQNLFCFEAGPVTSFFIFDWTVMPGESGTTAVVDGEKENTYLVIIRGQRIVFNKLPPDIQRQLKGSEGKVYGVGNLVQLHP